VRLLNRATAKRLLTDGSGSVNGVEYEYKGQLLQAIGPVVVATGGYGADFSPSGLLAKYRPDLASSNIATTNGEHCTGDGIRMAEAIGANLADMKQVQVHPTGLVDPRDPECKGWIWICFVFALFLMVAVLCQ
jgi:succinate dehydrogenase/fumarate reductase flavoprotein subunit